MLQLLLVLASAPALAAPDSNIADTETVAIHLAVTQSPGEPAPDLRGETCLLVSVKDSADRHAGENGAVLLKPIADAPSLCDSFAGKFVLAVSAGAAPATAVQAAFWNDDKDYPLRKWTLSTTVSGKEINEAYRKLGELCRGRICKDYEVVFANPRFAHGWLFPVSDFGKKQHETFDMRMNAQGPGGFKVISSTVTFPATLVP